MEEDFAGALHRRAVCEGAIMLLKLRPTVPMIVAAVGALGVLLTTADARALCLGDCNLDGKVRAGDVTRIVRIINRCDGAASGCSAINGTDKECVSADRNLDGLLKVDELMSVISNVISYPSGCPPEPTPPGTPLGQRTFSLGPGSGFFSSLAPTLKTGTPAGTLMLNATAPDAMGHATVTAVGTPILIQTNISSGGLALCRKIESCSGTLYCNGGANVDTLTQLDSLKAGLTCVRDGTNSCPDDSSSVCCSNSCEGMGVGSGNPTLRSAGVNATDGGAGAMLLMCHERVAQVPMPPADCSTADFTNALETVEFYTTGTSTAEVLHPCAGSGAPPNKAVTFSKSGQNFDCTNWTMENGSGILAFSIPSEEGSQMFTGDAANAGVYSDALATPTRTPTTPGGVNPTSTPTQGNTPPTATRTPTVQQLTATPTPTLPGPTLTPTTAGGPPLGTRVFSLSSNSGFFSSLLSGKVGTPMGTLMLEAGGMDSSGRATITLANGGTVIRTDLTAGGLTLCTKLDSCTGTLYCNGGADANVLDSLDSLRAGLTCVRNTTSCPPTAPTPPVCCSNACEGVGVGSGNSPQQTSPPPSDTPGTDSGPGAMLLICTQRSVPIMPVGDCSKADFSGAAPAQQYYTTGIDTAQVLNHCAGSGASASKVPKLARKGTNFDCSHWTMENGVGVLGFTIPSEEGSATITGDGANGGLWSDQ